MSEEGSGNSGSLAAQGRGLTASVGIGTSLMRIWAARIWMMICVSK